MPPKPYCANAISTGLHIRGRKLALKHDYIQLNPPHILQALVFDVDTSDAIFAADDANLPHPTFITQSKNKNGHAHLVYAFETPIAIHPNATMKPIRWAAAIQRGYTRRLGADIGYAGLMTKNPLTHATIALGRFFSLGDMDAWLDEDDKSYRRHTATQQGLGRNVDMFDTVRHEAYAKVSQFSSHESFHDWVLARCEQINNNFATPLLFSEPKATAKSVAKWVWRNRHRHGIGEQSKQRGVMAVHFDDKLSLRDRQIAAANYTAKLKAGRTLAAVQSAFDLLPKIGKKPTQKNVAEHAGLSLRTVKGYWKNIQK